MSSKSVVVLDFGSGNVHSVCRALEQAGASVSLSKSARDVKASAGLVIPGVGAFDSVMSKLRLVNAPLFIDQNLAAGKGVLGICVGLQVLFSSGTEHGIETEGLGQWPGVVERLEAKRLPHIGWSKLEAAQNSRLFKGVEDEYFYFVHSYGVRKWQLEVHAPFQPPAVSWADCGDRFVAAVENGPLMATQFHPEKSGEAGLKLLSNWIGSL